MVTYPFQQLGDYFQYNVVGGARVSLLWAVVLKEGSFEWWRRGVDTRHVQGVTLSTI